MSPSDRDPVLEMEIDELCIRDTSNEPTEADILDIFRWIDSIDFTRPKRNANRDFSDGVMMAELLHKYFPSWVNLRFYSASYSKKNKVHNWEHINTKVLPKLGYKLEKQRIDDLTESKPGAIEMTFHELRPFIARLNRSIINYKMGKGPEASVPVLRTPQIPATTKACEIKKREKVPPTQPVLPAPPLPGRKSFSRPKSDSLPRSRMSHNKTLKTAPQKDSLIRAPEKAKAPAEIQSLPVDNERNGGEVNNETKVETPHIEPKENKIPEDNLPLENNVVLKSDGLKEIEEVPKAEAIPQISEPILEENIGELENTDSDQNKPANVEEHDRIRSLDPLFQASPHVAMENMPVEPHLPETALWTSNKSVTKIASVIAVDEVEPSAPKNLEDAEKNEASPQIVEADVVLGNSNATGENDNKEEKTAPPPSTCCFAWDEMLWSSSKPKPETENTNSNANPPEATPDAPAPENNESNQPDPKRGFFGLV